ncbi:MAG: hypothetical protein R3B55_02050 [Candidatus Paceibacterota bacterium]
MNEHEQQKTFWAIFLTISIVAFCALCMPLVEVYFGWNMPFVNLDDTTLTVFGYKIVGMDRQFGFLMLFGIMLMIPSRTIHLSLLKLTEKKR